MYRRKEVQSEWGFIGDVLKIALGVFIGSMAAVFTYEGVLVWRAEQASRQVMKELKALEEKQKLARQQRLQQENAVLKQDKDNHTRKLQDLVSLLDSVSATDQAAPFGSAYGTKPSLVQEPILAQA